MRLTVRSSLSDPTVVHQKTWGQEHWIENNDEYCGKVLHIRPLQFSSMHFHLKKLETMYVISGWLSIELIDPDTGENYELDLRPGMWVQIPRGQPHRLIANEDAAAIVVEFSTKHEDSDSYRVSPGYKEE